MTKQTVVYTYEELSEHAQAKALLCFAENFCFDHEEECILEDIVERNPHIENMDISYSGFWSQGDGASFTGTLNSAWALEHLVDHYEDGDDKTVLAQTMLSGVKYSNVVSVVMFLEYLEVEFQRNSSHYVHENTCSTELVSADWSSHVLENEELYNAFDPLLSKFVEVIEEYRRNLCHAIYDRLDNAYAESTSEENIIEYFNENGFLFEESGDAY